MGPHTEPPLLAGTLLVTEQNISKWGVADWLLRERTLCCLGLQWAHHFACDLAAVFAFAIVMDWSLYEETADVVDPTQAQKWFWDAVGWKPLLHGPANLMLGREKALRRFVTERHLRVLTPACAHPPTPPTPLVVPISLPGFGTSKIFASPSLGSCSGPPLPTVYFLHLCQPSPLPFSLLYYGVWQVRI